MAFSLITGNGNVKFECRYLYFVISKMSLR